MKLGIFSAVTAASAMFAFSANAIELNFADYAAGQEGGVENSSVVQINGVNIKVRSGFVDDEGSSVAYFPYFDDVDGDNQPAGLGVCRALDGMAGNGAPGAECAEPGDDSIDGEQGRNEWIKVYFQDGPFDFRSISFRDGQHNSLNQSDGLVEYIFRAVDNSVIASGVTTFADLVMRAAAGEFMGVDRFKLTYVDTDFYIETISDIPIPGALPLLISGLAGIGFLSRRRKAAAAK